MGYKDDNYITPIHKGHNPYLQDALNKLSMEGKLIDMTNIPTAEEYAHTQYLKRRGKVKPGQLYPEPPSAEQISDMIEFAKLHVQAALQEAGVYAEIYEEWDNPVNPSMGITYKVDKESILNSYPLENIK